MISIKNLKHSYLTYKRTSVIKDFFNREYQKVEALDIDEIEIKEGEIVGFLGANGAGKTTLIKIITGIISPTSVSKIEVLGTIPYKKNKEYLKNIGVVLGQKSQLNWDLSPLDTIKLLKEIYEIDDKEYTERLDELTTLLNLKEKIHTPVRKLSLGERLKFELICSLIHNPKILFLDEPTIGIDIISQSAIHDFLHKINKKYNTTIILTSHYMKDIEALCKRVIVIVKGKKYIDSDVSNLLKEYKLEKSIIVELSNDENIHLIGNAQKIENKKYRILLEENIDKKYIIDTLKIENILKFEEEQKGLEEIIFEIFKGND